VYGFDALDDGVDEGFELVGVEFHEDVGYFALEGVYDDGFEEFPVRLDDGLVGGLKGEIANDEGGIGVVKVIGLNKGGGGTLAIQ